FARSYLRQVTTWRAARSAASAVAAVIPTCQGVPFKCADDAELVDTAPSSLLCTVSTFGMASTERESSQPDSTADDWGNSEFLSSMNLCDEPDKACKHERKQSCTHDRRGWRHAICTAAQKGDVADAKRLLATECACAPHEADARTAKERALLNACVYGHTDLLRLLLAHGVNVDAQLENGMTGLLYAAARNRVQCVEVLLDHGADLHHVGPYGSTALHWAADKGAAECVRRGANFTAEDKNRALPLYCAVKGYGSAFERRHLRDTCTRSRRNPSCDYLESVRVLCRPEYITRVPQQTKNFALCAAIEKGNVEITQYLLDENIADLSYTTIEGETVMHIAAFYSNVENIRALVMAGADVNCRENKGRTPLHFVRSSSCAEELIRWGADVLAQDFEGLAAVHYASARQSEDLIRILVAAGADVAAECIYGETALHICAHLSHLACVTLLLDLGADINAKTVEGMTPLHYTAQTKNLSCTQNWYEGACRQRPAGLDGAALGGARGLDERLQYLLARGWACRSRTAAGRRRCTWPCGEGNARCRGG
ncbi:Ankyrin repeat, PH and SEC7 domain containing protein, partial [Gryllus bimaculatus]